MYSLTLASANSLVLLDFIEFHFSIFQRATSYSLSCLPDSLQISTQYFSLLFFPSCLLLLAFLVCALNMFYLPPSFPSRKCFFSSSSPFLSSKTSLSITSCHHCQSHLVIGVQCPSCLCLCHHCFLPSHCLACLP